MRKYKAAALAHAADALLLADAHAHTDVHAVTLAHAADVQLQHAAAHQIVGMLCARSSATVF